MSDLISTAPLYAKERVHQTKLGNILCTGRGCIGCDRKHQHEDRGFCKLLGDVDSVDFGSQKPRFPRDGKIVPCSETSLAASCHGNHVSVGGNSDKVETNIRNRKKKRTKRQVNAVSTQMDERRAEPRVKMTINARKKFADGHNRRGQEMIAKPKLGKQGYGKRVSFAPILVREATFQVERETHKPTKYKVLSLSERKTKEEAKIVHAYTEVNSLQASSLYPALSTSPKTNFLEMLRISKIGIFDVHSMKRRESSSWVKKALESGAKMDEIFPQKLNKKNYKIKRAPKTIFTRESIRDFKQNGKQDAMDLECLPKLRSRIASTVFKGHDSVLVVGQSVGKTGIATEDSLHKLGFRVEQTERWKSFPKISILDIAESLEDFVNLGAVKLIHKQDQHWSILVSGKMVRDFLVQNGVELRGRNFELFDVNEEPETDPLST